MHPHLVTVFGGLATSRAELRDAVAAIPADLRRTRPMADRWSAIEIVEHVSLVENRFTKALTETIAKARAAGLDYETGRLEPLPPSISAFLPDRANKRTAPDPARPTGLLDEAHAWASADAAREAFTALLRNNDGLALSTVFFEHFFFGRLNVYQWAIVLAGHESRHASQVREVAVHVADLS